MARTTTEAAEMTAGDEYTVSPEAVRSVVGNVGGILVGTLNLVSELESLELAPNALASIGSPVATANTEVQGQLISAMRQLLGLLQTTNGNVNASANAYEAADQAVAAGYGGQAAAAATPTAVTPGTTLAGQVMADGAGSTGDPHAVAPVVDSLSRLSGHPVSTAFASPAAFADWLDDRSEHQQQVGVLGVYSGDVASLAKVPGGLHAGDVVVAAPYGPSQGSELGVVGSDGRLYNDGVVSIDTPYGADVRVYRPMSAGTSLW
jgi:uncharacterized protein YukE